MKPYCYKLCKQLQNGWIYHFKNIALSEGKAEAINIIPYKNGVMTTIIVSQLQTNVTAQHELQRNVVAPHELQTNVLSQHELQC